MEDQEKIEALDNLAREMLSDKEVMPEKDLKTEAKKAHDDAYMKEYYNPEKAAERGRLEAQRDLEKAPQRGGLLRKIAEVTNKTMQSDVMKSLAVAGTQFRKEAEGNPFQVSEDRRKKHGNR